MSALNLKFHVSLLLIMASTIFSSCKFDNEEHMYSSRSYGETYALLCPYIIVGESDEFELSADKHILDSLRVDPGHIAKLKGDLYDVNQQTRKALNDPSCSQVFMVTERQGALAKKTDTTIKYEIRSNDQSPIATRASAYMSIDANQGGSANFTGGPQVRTDISISPGWASPFVLNFNCRTGRLSDGKNYIYFTGTTYLTLTNWWNANSPNGNNTQWNFFAQGLSNGAQGSVSFQW